MTGERDEQQLRRNPKGQTIAAETADFSKEAIEANSAYVEKLMSAKTLEELIQIQSEFAKSNYDRLTAQATKIGELYTNLAKEAFKPAEDAFAKFQAAVGGTMPGAG
ncbi:MAG: phasin family protein [Methylovirgula sp.]